MLSRSTIGAAVLLLAAAVVGRAGQADAEAEKYIVSSEQQWAEASLKRDTRTVERIVADDFVGVDPNGSYFRKADELASVSKNEGDYVAAKGNEVKVRFYGDAAVAQGSESWQKRNGERGRYVWTDTWIRRGGRWQIVAAVDVKVPEAGK